MFEGWTQPARAEIEVSVFGRGYGESIVIHLGDGKWVVVDSLLSSGTPVPLHYLEAVGANVEDDVALVVATHWHDDHIRGLAAVCDKAKSATIAFPQAMLNDEFMAFARKFVDLPVAKVSSGVREMERLLDILKVRNWARFEMARAWTTLLRYHPDALSHGAAIEIEAMSPSNFDMVRFLATVAADQGPEGIARRAPRYDRNDVSCALHVRFGGGSIVLGADLENVADLRSGWKAVFGAQQLPPRTSLLLKVPHHGSATGHHPDIWTRLCLSQPVATLATWANGDKKLPLRSDVVRIMGLAGESFSTSPSSTSGDRHPLQAVNSVLRRTKSKVRKLDARLGHVRHRIDATDPAARWRTELFGRACPLSQVA